MDGQYDEFGNFIGKIEEEEAESSSTEETSSEESSTEEDNDEEMQDADAPMSTAVVLHEDKKYYPEADEVYGEETDIVVGEEDAQPIEVPIIAPTIEKKFNVDSRKSKKNARESDYLHTMTQKQQFIRNITIAGYVGHGKTSFFDYLLAETGGYTDTRLDEQQRKMSVKPTPVTTLMEDSRGKNYLFNMIDSPGHIDFLDEVTASVRLSDGLVLCIDVIEGLRNSMKKTISHALRNCIPMVLVLNKIDRLILELHIPPHDAYRKMQHVIGEVNTFIQSCPVHPNYCKITKQETPRLSPELGNVCFASAKYGWSFTLKSFAKIYQSYYGGGLDADRFAARLWGSIYYNSETKTFNKKPETNEEGETDKVSFVSFILEPLYKMKAHVVGEDPKSLTPLLDELGVRLWKTELKQDAEPLLHTICSRFFDNCSGFNEMIIDRVPCPGDIMPLRAEAIFTGKPGEDCTSSVCEGKADGELVVHVTKLFHRSDGSGFDAFGRVYSGTLKHNSQVKILGEAYTLDDPEDMSLAETGKLWLCQGRSFHEVPSAPPGSLVLIEGIDDKIVKTATICSPKNESMRIFKPLQFPTKSVVKVAVEPLLPSELPKMIDALRKVNKTFPNSITKVEESGEHIIMGAGEVHLDCMLHDLRKMYSDIEVKVSDPVTLFTETVIETSSLKCNAESPNKKNKITMIAEPLEDDLAKDIVAEEISLDMPKKKIRTFLEEKYGWDTLAARSIWAFGPDTNGPNVLLDDTIASETNRERLLGIKDSIVQGFDWGTRDGPLCGEEIRNVKFRILEAQVAEQAMQRANGQIIPAAKRVTYSAFLMATPRIMEPVYSLEITTSLDCVPAILTLLTRRRGHIVNEAKLPGTPLFVLSGYVPIMDSFGLETDIRTHTHGQAFIQCVFDRWTIVPSDPLDRDIVLRPLEPSQPHFLARDYMVKTRRRKGMTDDVSISKYFDDPMLLELAKHGADLGM